MLRAGTVFLRTDTKHLSLISSLLRLLFRSRDSSLDQNGSLVRQNLDEPAFDRIEGEVLFVIQHLHPAGGKRRYQWGVVLQYFEETIDAG